MERLLSCSPRLITENERKPRFKGHSERHNLNVDFFYYHYLTENKYTCQVRRRISLSINVLSFSHTLVACFVPLQAQEGAVAYISEREPGFPGLHPHHPVADIFPFSQAYRKED